MASRLFEWSVIALFPAGIFVLLGVLEVPTFADPCHTWGDPEGEGTATASPDPSCIGRTSTEESRMQAATRLLLFQGTVFLAMIVAVIGAARGHRIVVGAAAGILTLISIPLVLSLSFVFPLASAVLLGVGLLLNRSERRPRLARR